MNFATSAGVEADLADEALRLDVRRLHLAELGLVREAQRLLVEAEHERGVAVALDGAGADDVARARLDHGDRDGLAVVREHLGHSELLAEQTDLLGHGRLLLRNEAGIYTRRRLRRQVAGGGRPGTAFATVIRG